MPQLNIDYKVKKSAQDTFQDLQKVLTNHPLFKKLDPSYSCRFDKKTLQIQVSGKLFEAEVKLKETKNETKIEIKGKMPFAMSLFKSQVEKILKQELEKTFKS